MPDQDVPALHDAHAEEIAEHDAVDRIGTRRQGVRRDPVDEIRDRNLRKAVGELLAHGGESDPEEVAELAPGKRHEPAEREGADVDRRMDAGEEQEAGDAAPGGRPGGPRHAERGTAPVPEDEQVVAEHIERVGDGRDGHRRLDPSDAAERRAEGEGKRLEERERAGDAQVGRAVRHQVLPQAHQPQDRLRLEEEPGARRQAENGVEEERDADDLHEPLAEPRAVILRQKTSFPTLKITLGWGFFALYLL